jgi:NADH-quinone oxidoreductase subunit L
MSELLLWSWLFTLPGLMLSANGLGRPKGLLSVPGPAVLGLVALVALLTGGTAEARYPGWLPFLPDGAFHLRADSLAAAMLAVVGLVSTAVYIYSLGYMKGDPGQARFFAFLDLFVGAMTLLVLGGNLAVVLIGWAGVGLSSFLLISFWNNRPGSDDRPLKAGLQALTANAIGDASLLLAIVLLPIGCGDLTTLHSSQCTSGLAGPGLMGALILIAAAAKSAQGPLYFWLPSAMAGPTPVSALIHAATMVAAGVYLLVRVSPLLELSEPVLQATAVIGVATAILAGVLSLFQANFKRSLAYSTVSQLGFMFAAIGVGAPFAAFFHLVTHASFKALLFLAAGVVIHFRDGEEQLARLGGLRRSLPWAYAGFLIGSLALIGVPFTAGAFSKDAILDASLHRLPIVAWLLAGATFLSGLYSGRMFFGVFHGSDYSADGEHEHTEVEPAPMRWPLMPLAIGALILGYLEWPYGILSRLLGGAVVHAEPVSAVSTIGSVAAGLGILGFAAAGFLRGRTAGVTVPVSEPVGVRWVEPIASTSEALSRLLGGVHSGHLGRYLLASLIGIVAIIWIGLRT